VRKHYHNFGPWTVIHTGEHAHLPEQEYLKATWAAPMWVQTCECGQEHRMRGRARPKARTKFREMWGVKLW